MENLLVRQKFTLSKKVFEGFVFRGEALEQDDQTTQHIILLAAYIILLKHYTGNSRFRVGYSDFNYPEEKRVDMDIPDELDCFGLINRLLDKILGPSDFMEEKDAEEFFPVYFSMFEKFNESLDYTDLNDHHIRPASHLDYFHSALQMFHNKSIYGAWILCRASHFDSIMVDRMRDHYLTILNDLLENPSKKVRDVNIVSPEELALLFNEWQGPVIPFPDHQCLHERIEEQAKKTPELTALISGDQEVSYTALDQRANYFARQLLDRGLKQGEVVAVLMDLSVDAVAAILGILKAGGVFVAMDPAHPLSRHQYMISDCAPRFLICTRDQASEDVFPTDRIILSDSPENLHGYLDESPGVHTDAGAIAYLMYTSGSTGDPKAVMITHRNIVHNLFVTVRRNDLKIHEKTMSMTSLSFDTSISKLFSSLTVGGAVILPAAADTMEVERLILLLQKHKPVLFPSTPAILRLINQINPDLSFIRIITTGGEPARYRDFDKIIRQVRIMNIYGPTEATVSSVSYTIPREEPEESARVPIGKPNPNCTIYILDDRTRPLPAGAFGTLYIGGKGVTKGYLNNPEMTAKKFIPDPFKPGETIYNSGDIARWLPDGTIDFLGRKDNQIKIRTYRVEIEEVEKIMNRSDLLKEAKIIVKEEEDGDKAMIACIVPKNKESFQIQDLKNFMQAWLPAPIVPSEYISFEKLPVNRSNKIDTRELLRIYLEKRLQTPDKPANLYKNNVEKIIADFWKSRLHRPALDPEENLFHIGGNSLSVMQLKLHIQEVFDLDVPVKALFDHQTTASLSEFILSKVDNPEMYLKDVDAIDETDDVVAPVESPVKKWKYLLQIKAPRVDRIKKALIATKNKLPLSFHEERLWFLYKLQSEKYMYNILKAYTLKGRLDPVMLEESLNQVVNRHENLKKRFYELDGEVVAALRPRAQVKIKRVCNQTEAFETLFEREIEKESETPFDLTEDIMVRATLVAKNDFEHRLILATHHIVADGWSFNILMRELHGFYSARGNNERLELEPLTKAYAGYPFYYKTLLNDTLIRQQARFWKQKLNGRIERLRLPYDLPATQEASAKGGHEEIWIPATLTGKLSELAKERNITPFMLYLSAFQILLHRYTGQEFVHIGIPVADREHVATRDLVGFFVNTLLIPSTYVPGATFEEALVFTRGEVLEAFGNKELPYDMLAETLGRENGIRASELLQVMFDFQNLSEPVASMGDMEVDEIRLRNYNAKFDLTVSLSPEKDGLLLYAEYKKGLFSAETIRQLLATYIRLLNEIGKNPAMNPDSFDLISPEEKRQTIYEWNDTARLLEQTSVHRLFERQVAARPEEVALVTDDGGYTYRRINEKANELAHKLIASGLREEEMVGVLMEETADAIVAQIAILKAGGAFVPLDPANPKDRLDHMIRQCAIRHVVTNAYARSRISEGESIHWYMMDSQDLFDGRDINNPDSRAEGDGLAYVMFTSGSTGLPKAVGVEHRSVVRLVINTNYVPLDASCRILKTGAFSFDASTFEIWGALLNGGRLYLYSKDKLLDYTFVKQKIAEHGITHAWFTSSWFNQLVDLDKTMFGSLQYLLTGGDKLSPKHVNKIRKASPRLKLINGYGPTENTTFSLTLSIEEDYEDSIPIGKPIANSTAYVLDKNRRPVPVGVQGELYVGGLGVARGYINDPELTESRFVEDPFFPGRKMYKTGDLGKWLRSGVVEFIGRNDQQVKIRGFRIEPGEVENVIASHPQIEEAAVIVKEINGEKQLIAFYKSREDIGFDDLYGYLKGALTEVMIPGSFTRVEEMPLTANGKTDRKKLATMAISEIKPVSMVAPSNQVESKLAAIFAEVLGKNQVGITDNFFHSGGHSLLATRLMARIEKAFNKELPLSLLFQAPTVKDLSAIIMGPEFNSVGLVPIQPKGNRTPIFLLPGYLFYYNLSKVLGNNQPLYGFEPIAKFRTEDIARYYIKQIREIQPEGPYFIGGYCASGILAFEMARQLKEAGQEPGWLALFEVYTPEATVAKASGRYLSDKLAYWKAGFTSGSLKGKYKLVTEETAKLFNYFFKNTFRKILHDYTIKPYEGRILLFKSMDGMVGSAGDPYMGWSKYCPTERISLIEVPGDHSTIFKDPNVKVIADKLKESMDQVLEGKKV